MSDGATGVTDADTRARLRDSALLAACGSAELDAVLARATTETLAPGDRLFDEDDRPDAVWVVLDGDVAVSQAVGDDELVLDYLRAGDHLGEIPLLAAAPAGHRARSKGGAHLLRIPGDAFRALLHACDGVMATVVRTLADRMRRMETLLQQRERMAGLGEIAAGLAHELNNPAAAATRAAAHLRDELDALEVLARRLVEREWTPGERALLARLSPDADGADGADDAAAHGADALERSDREEALQAWLDAHDVAHAWSLAPMLAARGVTPAQLDALTAGCEADVVADALAWSGRTATMRQLLDEVAGGAGRIRELVGAVKAYSYADTTTRRIADLHEGLQQALTILGHKLRAASVQVTRDWDRALPPVAQLGTELTQVWTNLLDNAIDAMEGTTGARTVRVRTRRDGEAAVVEVADAGPGIPPAVRERMFDPFYTTKAAGRGTGLGLQIVKRIVLRHGGTIAVDSDAGGTRVTVRLPLDADATARPSGAADAR